MLRPPSAPAMLPPRTRCGKIPVLALVACGLWLVSLSAVAASPVPEESPGLVERAETAYGAGDWGAAQSAYERVARENPYHADYPYRQGMALLRLEHWDEAVDAFRRARALGLRAFDCDYRIAQAHARAGRQEEALDWLERALVDDAPGHATVAQIVRRDEAFAGLHGTAAFERLTGGAVEPSSDPVAARRADLEFLVDRLERVHYDLHHQIGPDRWAAAVQDLDARLADLDDLGFAAELARLVTLVGDGHTRVELEAALPDGGHRLPIMLYRFRDGLHVRAAAPEYAELVGGRILSLGGRAVEDLVEEAAAYAAHDNAMQLRHDVPRFLVSLEFLRLLGAAPAAPEVQVPIEVAVEAEPSDGGSRTVRMEVEALPLPRLIERFSDALSEIPRFDERVEIPAWVSMHQPGGSDGPTPLWLRHPYRPYWFEVLPEEGLVYAQYNDAVEEETYPFERFVDELFAAIEGSGARALVLDVRLNSGGETYLARPLVERLLATPALHGPGGLFVITGRRTSSSGMRFTSTLEQWTDAIFVGEPTGQPPNTFGGVNVYRLPHSGLPLRVSSRLWIGGRTSDDHRPWIAPDLVAELTAADYAAGIDPAMESIRHALARRETKR